MALTVDVALAGCGGIIVMPYYVIFLGTMRILHLLTLHLDSQWQLLAGRQRGTENGSLKETTASQTPPHKLLKISVITSIA